MSSGSISIGLAGDLMLGRGVGNSVAYKGCLHPWGNLLPLLRSTDLNIGNLETTLTNSETPVPKVFNFRARPATVQCLKEANFGLLNLANNHILDYDVQGLKDTLETLDTAGIQHAGAGMDMEEAAKPAVTLVRNIRLGLLGFTDNEEGWRAGFGTSGTNYIDVSNLADRAIAIAAVQQLRKETDLLVVSIHWGPNMRETPPAVFVEFAHELVREGADIIHGHSAHIFQGIEVYQNKLILYDTGDFIDDYVVDAELRNDCSFFYVVDADRSGILRLKLLPVRIRNNQVNLAWHNDYSWSMKRIRKLSAPFGTEIGEDGVVRLKS